MMTKQMLTMLLVTSIVASNLSGLDKSSSTRREATLLSLSSSSMSLCVSEKKATSEPDAIAEHMISTTAMMAYNTTLPKSILLFRAIAVTSATRSIAG